MPWFCRFRRFTDACSPPIIKSREEQEIQRNPKSRSSFLCCLILILVVLLTACAGSGAGTGSAAGSAKAETDNNAAKPGQGSSAAAAESDGSAAEPGSDGSAEPLRIGVLKIADSFPLYAAVEEGLFEKRGLQVEIIEFQSASDQSVAYEAGELDGMMTDMIVQSLINKAAGEDGMRAVAMALGGSPEEGRFLVVSSPSAGIDSPEDLVGKRIGISENTMMEYLVTRYLEDLGIDPGQTQMVNIPKLTLRLDAVMEGKDIQAAILPDPLAIEAVERVNERQKSIVYDKMVAAVGSLAGKTVAIVGLSFKPETDDMREAPALVVIDRLLKDGATIRVFDPIAMDECRRRIGDSVTYCKNMYDAADGADVFALMTEWRQFRMPSWNVIKKVMTGNVIIDGRNIYDRQELEELGFVYSRIGEK